MKIRQAVVAAPLTALMLGGSANAQPVEAVSLDGRCAAFGAMLSRNSNPQYRSVGEMMMNFFLGRISAVGKPVDLDRAIIEVTAETKGGISPMRDKCADVFDKAKDLLVAKPAPAKSAK